ncbi:hypothetical protein PBY51_023276 [Eleginops maclovinus]|uniref:Uncharacterized protein n=1 Tax=Eleginops maclovinus TaxID=56733 RepID=A0AAN7WTX3_ELEMC|nr:hypothetical protein PBY51_023276 [Eleginops maclovinus]
MRRARGRKKAKSVLKIPARSLPWERAVMRFSSNEGQNMAPDVILILIKEGSGVLMGGWGVESILLNTINPFLIFGGTRAGESSAACSRPRLLVLETWRSAAGDQSWTSNTGGVGSSRASNTPYISRPGRGGVGSALPLVSLEMIACPGARGEERARLPNTGLHERGTPHFIPFKPHISSPTGGIYWPKTPSEDSFLLGKKAISLAF